MTNILCLENGGYGGGSFESLFLLVTHLDRTRWRPIVVFVNETPFVERLRERGIRVFCLHDALYSHGGHGHMERWMVRLCLLLMRVMPRATMMWERILHRSSVRALRDIMRKERVDVLLLNNQCARDLYGVIAASSMGVRCVSYVRSVRTDALPPIVTRFLNTYVASFIANSQYTKQYWESMGLDASKVHVVYNAIETRMVVALNIRHGWSLSPSTTALIGCVGNLVDGKGHAFLLRAFTRVLEREPHAVLILVGDGPRHATLVESAYALGIHNAVVFVGYDARAREIIAGLDVLVVPSRTEAFGRTLLEAMAVGTPIVATRVGGIPEVVEHERNGLLVTDGDEGACAAAIIRFLHDDALRSRCIQNGLQRVRDFHPTTHVRTLEHILISAT